jgi:hypothetical protein
MNVENCPLGLGWDILQDDQERMRNTSVTVLVLSMVHDDPEDLANEQAMNKLSRNRFHNVIFQSS